MKQSRRNFLKGIGVAGIAAGAGVATLSGAAAAEMTSSFAAGNPQTVTSDDGNLTEVFVDPRVYTSWSGFDEEPMKLRYVLEAGIDGQGFKPVHRETPWLYTEDDNGNPVSEYDTSDRYPDSGRVPLASKNSDFYTISNGNFVAPNDGSQQVPPKVVLFKEGMGDYYDEPSDYDGHGGGSGQNHWDGSSLGDDSGAYANGNYGVIGDTGTFDATTDGESKSTTVHLRLTTVLLDVNSESLMQAEYPAYSGDAGYTYGRLRNIAPDHPGVSVSTTSFEVTAENEIAESGTNGVANPGAK
jgi:hypothetical protein